MSQTISKEDLYKLFEIAFDDSELLSMIEDCLKTFEEYHQAIYEMETWVKLYNHNNVQQKEYQEKVSEMDSRRRNCHNAVLASVNILNRIATQFNIDLIYNGTVSEDTPYRREVADAVLGYVESVVAERK